MDTTIIVPHSYEDYKATIVKMTDAELVLQKVFVAGNQQALDQLLRHGVNENNLLAMRASVKNCGELVHRLMRERGLD